jgi:putative Mg2+ transporter-C (MgtC) family protein
VDIDTTEILLRLLTAAACGAVVGVEREATARSAGARTHALVALGAAAFTLAGAYGFADVERSGNVDPARVAAQVAAGVGFIGAGAIIRNGSSVSGVTTAATVWLAAALGVAAAAGSAMVAAISTGLAILVLVVLRLARPITRSIGRHAAVLEVEYLRGHGTLGPLLRAVEQLGGTVRSIHLEDDDDGAAPDGVRHVLLQIALAKSVDLEKIANAVGRRPEIKKVHLGAAEQD